MLPVTMGLVVIFSSWIASDILASLAHHIAKRSGFDDRFFRAIRYIPTDDQLRRVGRSVLFFSMVFVTGFGLSALIGIKPVYSPLVERLHGFLDFEITQAVLVKLPEFLILFLGIFLAIQLYLLIDGIFPRLYQAIEIWKVSHFREIKIQNLELVTPQQLADLLLRLAKYMRLGLTLLLLLLGLTFFFSYFPGTQGFVDSLVQMAIDAIKDVWAGLISFLPNLFTLVIIAIITRYSLKLLNFFYHGFRNGKVRIAGFHPELATPTYHILRFMILALALVAAFPFIPGSESPAFRGITIFFGFLVSLGSTSLVANIISGLVLTYTRGLKIGDRVQIGDTIGDVVERTILVTRLRTIKNVDVTIPNSMVLGNHIVNYSAVAEERGVILHTTITIGYDAPWRDVHQLLVDAALATDYIMALPAPFVLQTSLDNYYVSYELNAYTMRPSRMATIYSELHQNIQDRFNEAGIEIMSPTYASLRDGQHTTIPDDYLPSSYQSRPITLPW
jgi:small-conductance mechanosensitive channel